MKNLFFKVDDEKLCFSFPKAKSYKLKAIQGFTLIELIVTVGIFLLLTSLVMVNHSKFSGAVLLENLAYDVALSIRQAQVFGLSVKEFEPGTGEFQQGYGVHFNKNNMTQYVLFADRAPINLKYDASTCGGPSPECIETFTIRQGNRIKDFCVTVSGAEKCASTGAIDYINIVFVRPDPDALIRSSILGEKYESAKITIISPKGIERDVLVRLTGQISIPAAARHP